MIEKLVARGLLREPADFFQLEGAALEVAVGEKTATKLRAAADRGRSREAWRFVLGLGVPGVGPAGAKALAKRFGDLDALAAASTDALLDGRRSRIPGVSDAAAAGLIEFLEREGGRESLRRLQAALVPR